MKELQQDLERFILQKGLVLLTTEEGRELVRFYLELKESTL